MIWTVRRRTWLRWAGGVAATTLVLGVLAWRADPVAFANRHLGRVELLAREQLGRTLTIGTLEGHLFPTLHVVIHGVELSGAQPGEPAMLTLPRVEIRFRLARALWSLGGDLRLESVRVDGGVLRVRRDD